MKITLDIPEPKFKVGDFVRYAQTWRLNGFLVIGRVTQVNARGYWVLRKDGSCVADWDEESDYFIVVQEGSNKINGVSLRPGTLFGPRIRMLDEYGELFDYRGNVWSADTMERDGKIIIAVNRSQVNSLSL